jgi:hypothetical protein
MKIKLGTIFGFAAGLAAVGGLSMALNSAINTRNIPVLKREASNHWGRLGYRFDSVAAEFPSTNLFFSRRAFSESGGRLRSWLIDPSGGKVQGDSWLDESGYPNTRLMEVHDTHVVASPAIK